MKKIFSNKKILILGSNGFLGQYLFDELALRGCKVFGSIRKQDEVFKNRYVLDLDNNMAVKKFPWKNFDIIVDCSGFINYDKTVESVIKNIKSNTLIPLRIISLLNKKQKYFYCSTHAVFSQEAQHNAYSLSKLMFERCIQTIEKVMPKVTILRLPGLFHQSRKTGLLNLIRKYFVLKKPLVIDFVLEKWHTMYLPRVVDIIITAMLAKNVPIFVNIGYPLETNIVAIIKVAEQFFKYAIPINLKNKANNRYLPNLKNQELFYKTTTDDFKEDLTHFFKSKL